MSNLTLPDKIRSWFDPGYAARAQVARGLADARASSDYGWVRGGSSGGRHQGDRSRTDSGWSRQPFGPGQQRTLTPQVRRGMVQRSRQIAEHNVLGRSFLDRSADNIIGEGMKPQALTEDTGWNEAAESLWRECGQTIDASGRLHSHGEWQRAAYFAQERDGDLGGILLRGGNVQLIESDYVRSPGGAGDLTLSARGGAGPDIVEGVELAGTGRPVAFHIASYADAHKYSTTRIQARDFVWCFDNPRLDRTAVRGVPKLATMGWLLDQIDGTMEAVTIAYRMAAMFGLIVKKAQPGNAFGGLPNTATSRDGVAAPEFALEPGMVEYLNATDEITQVQAQHPNSQFDSLMTYAIRMAGLEFGLPLELALLDFSKTNYSSARASMEQAYRVFRCRRIRFANSILMPIYRWKVSRWMNEGLLPRRDDAWRVRWLGQPWPYLDPQKEAQANLLAVDAGFETQAGILAQRGYDFDEFIAKRAEEIQRLGDAGLDFARSNMTRDAGGAAPQQETNDDDEADERSGLATQG
jgi:lambda family phage portal protein